MAAVLTKMADNPLRPGKLRQMSGRHRVRLTPSPRFPESGNVVDVDRKARSSPPLFNASMKYRENTLQREMAKPFSRNIVFPSRCSVRPADFPGASPPDCNRLQRGAEGTVSG